MRGTHPCCVDRVAGTHQKEGGNEMETNGKMGSKKARDIIKAKRLEKKVTIAELAKTVGKNPTFLAAALHGNHRLSQDEAKKVGKIGRASCRERRKRKVR